MRTRKVCALPLVLLALAFVASGDDSWRKKPFSEWNEKEVRQILEKSPWAHRVKLMVIKPGARTTPCPAGDPSCSPEGYPTASSSPTAQRGTMSPDDLQALQEGRTSSPTPPALGGVVGTAVVRWASSRTVREAMFRSGVQRGRVKPQELQQPGVFAPLDAYVVYVDLRVALADAKKVPPCGRLTAAQLQNSVLVLKSTGERISPLSVRKAPLPEFDERKELALGAFYVYFPRMVRGKPSLPASETLVRFECPTMPVAITCEFDLQQMTREGLPDL